jgi:hypothetical protein
VLLIAEFVMAPINLWTRRTMPTFVAFTGIVCAVYLVRLAAPRRRNAWGSVGFAIFGSWAVALSLLLIVR